MANLVVLAVSVLLIAAGPVTPSKSPNGNVYGFFHDEAGNRLPGVTVTLETAGGPQVQLTDARGRVRFLDLPPAKNMTIRWELAGFVPFAYGSLEVKAGLNTTVEVTLVAAISDPPYVVPDTVLDERERAVGVTVSQAELQGIPTSREPWTLLQGVSGVQLGRINVAGRENSRQAVDAGPGASGASSSWAIDGTVVTDLAAIGALGASPLATDFDALEEVQITTGGADAAVATAGVALNLVPKRGTNEWRGSARYLNAPSAAQSRASFSRGQFGLGGSAPQSGFDQVRGIDDFGGEAGGPAVKDNLWLWGAYGNQKLSAFAGGIPYHAQLPVHSARINAMIGSANDLDVLAFQDGETVSGRDAGPMRPLATAWDQRRTGSQPTFARVQDTHIFSGSFYLIGQFSEVNGGFHLTPIGGLASTPYLGPDGVWHHSFTDYVTNRPQRQGKLDGEAFAATGSAGHEIKFGVSHRRVTTSSGEQWSGAGWILDAAWLDAPAGQNLLFAARAASLDVTGDTTSGYVQDTFSRANLKGTAGIRYDLQEGRSNPSTSPANPVLPALLPAYHFSGSRAGFSWRNFAPRLGLSYALGQERQTLLRASYSRFADQLGAGTVAFTNPAAFQSYYYFVTPRTGPGTPTVLAPAGFGTSGNVNPATRLPFVNNAVASNLSAGLTDEGRLSADHALSSDMAVGLELAYRRLSNIVDQDLLVFDCSGTGKGCAGDVSGVGRIARRGDYQSITVPANLPGGGIVPVTFYTLKPGVFTRNGHILVNGLRTQRYQAASLVVVRRLSHGLMLRGNFTVDSWRWGNTGGLPDPTEGPAGGARDGDSVLTPSGAGAGPEAYVYIGARWTANLNALYQIMPDRAWSFDLASNFIARQGYPLPYSISQPIDVNGNYAGVPREAVLAAGSSAAVRLANVYELDLRIAKELVFGDWALTLGIDCFNVFNASTVLQRVANLGTAARSPGTAGAVYEILGPRIFRFGARLALR